MVGTDIAGDQPGPAFEGQVVPQPADADGEAVAKTDQEVDVRHRPQKPGGETRDPDPPERDDGAAAPDGGQLRLTTGPEDGRDVAGEPRGDHARGVAALLFGDGRD